MPEIFLSEDASGDGFFDPEPDAGMDVTWLTGTLSAAREARAGE